MLIFSTKITKKKVLAFSLVFACLALILIIAIPSADAAVDKQNKTMLKTNEERIDFLANYGWSVESDPVEVVEVVIPSEFDQTYETYNSLQKTQGFDLSAFKGKKVIRYSYTITNYPTEQESPVRANMLLMENRLVGGDVTSIALGGFMHGFDMPTGTTTQPTSEAATSAGANVDDYDIFNDDDNNKAGLTPEEIADSILTPATK